MITPGSPGIQRISGFCVARWCFGTLGVAPTGIRPWGRPQRLATASWKWWKMVYLADLRLGFDCQSDHRVLSDNDTLFTKQHAQSSLKRIKPPSQNRNRAPDSRVKRVRRALILAAFTVKLMLITGLSVGFIQCQQAGFVCTATLPVSSAINLAFAHFSNHDIDHPQTQSFVWKILHFACTDVVKTKISTATLW